MSQVLVTGPNGTRFVYDCPSEDQIESVLNVYRETNPAINMPGSTIQFIPDESTETASVRLFEPEEE